MHGEPMEARTSTTPQSAMPTLLRCRVLTGLTKRIDKEALCTPLEDPDTLRDAARESNP